MVASPALQVFQAVGNSRLANQRRRRSLRGRVQPAEHADDCCLACALAWSRNKFRPRAGRREKHAKANALTLCPSSAKICPSYIFAEKSLTAITRAPDAVSNSLLSFSTLAPTCEAETGTA